VKSQGVGSAQLVGYLRGGLEHEFMIIHSVGNVIIPTDELIFFRGGRYTTNQQ
jgi:hypothetical protein